MTLLEQRETISKFSLIQLFKEHRAFITHEVAQDCLDKLFYSIEISKFRYFNADLFQIIQVNYKY